MQKIGSLIESRLHHHEVQDIKMFRLNIPEDQHLFRQLLMNNQFLSVHDDILGQLRELMKLRNPSETLGEARLNELSVEHVGKVPMEEFGVWVYYPWHNKVVHLLDESEFVEVRTVRNKYKITQEEQDLLGAKSVGIIGLSVGQSAALTLAMERICGELRLADFDKLELSNMNRLRCGVQNLELHKTEIVYREIMEIDPFIKVIRFREGITEANIDNFLTQGGKIDLLVEECDSIDVKIYSRYKCRDLGIPVVMETSDRGKLDVERFDLNPEMEIFHGKVDSESLKAGISKDLSNKEKIAILSKIADFQSLSERLISSLPELGVSITTWPQLSSDVVLGGALVAISARMILLHEKIESGQRLIDVKTQLLEESVV